MKIVQSFWSGNQTDFTNNYGWVSHKHQWMSWILSCHQLVKYHDEVELYTDRFGYEILIEKLQLPYTKVYIVLDELNDYDKNLWAVAKIKTFQLQEEPFLHVDGDVFVWESLTNKFKKSSLIAQNLEIATDYYASMWNEISQNLMYMPIEMENYHNKTSNLSCNMGIIGGNDIDFFKEYTKASFDFVDKNRDSWDKINCFNFNIFFEQLFFYELTKNKNTKIDFFFEEALEDNKYIGFGDFDKVPKKTYLHLLGTYKRDPLVCKAMEIYTMKYYPEHYSKLSKMVNEHRVPEIDFLNPKKVEELITQFARELTTNTFEDEHYLLKRDLYNEGIQIKFDSFLEYNQDFSIVKLKNLKLKNTTLEDNTITITLEIEALNCRPEFYNLDHIDEIILTETTQPINYKNFIIKMKDHFEEEGEESQLEFVSLLNQRLRNYLLLKIISIYN